MMKPVRLSTLLSIFILALSLGACVRASANVPTPPVPAPTRTLPAAITLEPPTPYSVELPTLLLPTPKPPNIGEALGMGIETAVEAQTKGAATEAARGALAQMTGIPPDQIVVLSAESVTWSDTCMEIPTFTDCQPFGVPGFRVVLQANNQTFEYHTNFDGSSLGLASTQP